MRGTPSRLCADPLGPPLPGAVRMPRIRGSRPGRFFSGVHAPSASHLNTTPLPPGSNSGTSGDGGDNVEDYALDDPPTESSAAEPPAQSPSKEERQAVLATGKTTYVAESPAPFRNKKPVTTKVSSAHTQTDVTICVLLNF